MPDLYEITDAQIIAALLDDMPGADASWPPSAEYIAQELVPTVRKLLNRPRPGYTYRAIVREWVDADTVDLNIDLGVRQWVHDERIRLLGVNAPDRNPAKAKATAWMRSTAPVGSQVVVTTHKDETEKYGRLLGDLYLGDLHLNTALIDAGLGQPYAGGVRPADY
jgi:micrococcal nuclease